MSCLIQKSENVAIIATFISRLLNQGFNSFGFSADRDVIMAFRDCQGRGFYNDRMIYEKLYEANFKAYNKRYENSKSHTYMEFSWEFYKDTEAYAYNEVDIWEHRVFSSDGHDIPQEWHYKVLKSIQFLLYQVADNGNEDPIYKALESLQATLAMYIITNSEKYRKIKWE